MTTPAAPPPAAQTCPDCSGSGVGGTRRHGPEPEQWEALRCERCDGEGRIAPPAAQTREPGWYWVRGEVHLIGSDWRGAEWRDDQWLLPGDDNSYLDDDFTEIGPRIPSPAERPGDAALAERLRSVIFAALMLRDHRADEEMGMEIDDETDLLVKAITDDGALSPAPRDGGWNGEKP